MTEILVSSVCSSYHALFVSFESAIDSSVEGFSLLKMQKSELLLLDKVNLILPIKDSADGMPEKSGPNVGRQAVTVEALHSIPAHITLLSTIPITMSRVLHFIGSLTGSFGKIISQICQ